MLIAIAVYFNLEIEQFDTINAFTNSRMDKETYVELPDGKKKPGHILRCWMALYGFNISPLL